MNSTQLLLTENKGEKTYAKIESKSSRSCIWNY